MIFTYVIDDSKETQLFNKKILKSNVLKTKKDLFNRLLDPKIQLSYRVKDEDRKKYKHR